MGVVAPEKKSSAKPLTEVPFPCISVNSEKTSAHDKEKMETHKIIRVRSVQFTQGALLKKYRSNKLLAKIISKFRANN